MSDTAATVKTDAPRRAPLWLTVTVAIVFGLFYAYDLWEAVGNLVGLNIAAGDLDTSLGGSGWAVLIIGVLIPVVVYGVVFWLGRRRAVGVQALMYITGLCLVAVLSLDMYVMFSLGNLIV
ncbi:bacitracin resistance protein [Cryobacterium frigoriphilum]|uniref:Bacitracin resistance protein n=1 Tax=Cryobacterium frigoriphilum TaxID=1259150 RepID=A0A4R9A1P5_9MICO|nr:bacitracin resistance protein [Cryobacterium frigoriphilum]TFD50485.1 bacitracin resistance protein [Cryobacterium frigoriphilum]